MDDAVVLFWLYHPFSNYYPGPDRNWTIDLDGTAYRSSEQIYMAAKAVAFPDPARHAAIMAATSPDQAKQIAKFVKGFDRQQWLQVRSCASLMRAKQSKLPDDGVVFALVLAGCTDSYASGCAGQIFAASLVADGFAKHRRTDSRRGVSL
eukprot:SAG31_NODE_1989_length_6721_cov_5.737391_6_plen_150_part_00